MSVLQALLYIVETIWRSLKWLAYFDPRLGLRLLELAVSDKDGFLPGILSWASVALLAWLGFKLSKDRKVIGLYILFELLAALPSLLLVLLLFLGNPLHPERNSRAEPIILSLALLAFTVLPLLIAVGWVIEYRVPNRNRRDNGDNGNR